MIWVVRVQGRFGVGGGVVVVVVGVVVGVDRWEDGGMVVDWDCF